MTEYDVTNAALPFLACREIEIGPQRAMVARLSITGELGYEINVPASGHRVLYGLLTSAGRELGLTSFGLRALDSLRLEKSYGSWGTEFSQGYTPAASGLDRFIAYDKPDFVGRDAVLHARQSAPGERLVTLAIDAVDADAAGYEPIHHDGRRVGYVTSGAYGHFVGESLAMAYVESAIAAARPPLTVTGGRRGRARRVFWSSARTIPRARDCAADRAWTVRDARGDAGIESVNQSLKQRIQA
ncbi:MAG: glycine cleavage T C-terminal barrel domain-containing protein [Hyphomicrobiaceae bacterium]